MNLTETRSTRIAVFIDFDNVEIGVKSTIGGQFDIGLVLEAIKERGEIVTKIAYSDWKRAGDYSRILTQHAIRMVQRNLTPGGDKNGADITMALDALEMAFTHDHINAFVIVGGDSDFISLVEKLKQYGRKVIVVGGRQFTSATMQKNCHEFIAYENLAGGRGRTFDRGRTGAPPTAGSAISHALPLVKRALKVLSDREVTPQLGLLKSTLLQLDSTFSEREYGASSFRDFMEKVAQTGAVTLKHSGRSMLVEARDDVGEIDTMPAPERPVVVAPPPPAEPPVAAAPPMPQADAAMPGDELDEDEETLPSSPMSMQDGIKAVQQAFNQAAPPPRWPMYVRQAKQFLRNAVEGFDERKYGFASVVDLLRAAGKEGVVRIERDRQGAVRVFPGANLVPRTMSMPQADVMVDEPLDLEVDAEPAPLTTPEPASYEEQGSEEAQPLPFVAAEAVSDPPILDADVEAGSDTSQPHAQEEEEYAHEEGDVNGNRVDARSPRPAAAPRKRKTTTSRTPTRTTRAPRATKTTSAASSASSASAARPARPARPARAPRGRKTSR